MAGREMSEDEITPRPDPTTRTVEQLGAAIAGLREVFETRFEANDRAILLLQRFSEREPTLTQVAAKLEQLTAVVQERAVAATSLSEERFRAINKQFDNMTTLFDEQIKSIHGRFAQDNLAVGTALQSAKDAVAEQKRSSDLAVAKSETATSDQLKQINELIRATSEATNRQLAIVGDRLTRLEEWRVVAAASTTEHRTQVRDVRSEAQDTRSNTLVVAGLILTAAISAVSLFVNLNKQVPIVVDPGATTTQSR